MLQPLTDALKGAPKTLEWPPAAAAAFGSAKAALVAAVPLAHPAPNAVLSLATDASDTHVGGVLQQLTGGRWQLLAFYSKKLSGAGNRYSNFHRELLAAFSAVRHFRFLLEGRQFRLLTDHKSLVTSLFRTTPPWSARQQRQLSFIAEFTSDTRHQTHTRPGERGSGRLEPHAFNIHAAKPTDLSRSHRRGLAGRGAGGPGSAHPGCQRRCAAGRLFGDGRCAAGLPGGGGDDELLHIADHNPDRWQHDAAWGRFDRGVPPARADPTQGGGFPVAALYTPPGSAGDPPPHRRPVLLATNGHYHYPDGQGLPTMPAGQGSQARTPTTNRDTGTPPPFRPPPRGPGRAAASCARPHLPFHHHYRTSRWLEAIPLASISAADCARALFAGWVSRFGVPATITSDRGAQFTSALWAGLCSLLNIQHSPTTAYHPQSNGLVERFHRQLKDALRSRAAAADWHDHHPWVLLGIRAPFREDSEFSPAEAV
jgi:hypothetical protein